MEVLFSHGNMAATAKRWYNESTSQAIGRDIMGIVITIVCIYIFFAFIGDFGKDRRQKELLDTIKSTKSSEGNQERFPCPSCAEMVLVQANVCRYCGRDLPEDVKPVKPEIIAPPLSSTELSNHPMRKLGRLIRRTPMWILFCITLAVIGVLGILFAWALST